MKTALAILAALSLAALSLSGCGKPRTAEPPPSAADGATAAPDATASAKPEKPDPYGAAEAIASTPPIDQPPPSAPEPPGGLPAPK